MKRALLAACLFSSLAFAGPNGGAGKSTGDRAERQEEISRKSRMMALVGIAEALELSDADALKLSDKLKSLEDRRKPIRDSMSDSMRAIKAAAEGDVAAMATIDQNVTRLLDGRSQMAALDKEMFAQLSVGQTPLKKAKLAMFLAKFGEELRHMKGNKGRFFRHQ